VPDVINDGHHEIKLTRKCLWGRLPSPRRVVPTRRGSHLLYEKRRDSVHYRMCNPAVYSKTKRHNTLTLETTGEN